MLGAMLEERFHLVAHLATTDQTAWAITVAKGGPKMKAAGELDRSGCDTWRDAPAFPGAKTCTNSQTAEDGSRRSVALMTDSKYGPSRNESSRERSEMEF